MRLGILASHPIQYQAPIFRALAQRCDLTVYFAHRQSAQQQGEAGYGSAFDWDVDLSSGYQSVFLANRSKTPGVDRFFGCDTPEVAAIVANGAFDAFIAMGWNLRSYWQVASACRRHRVPVLVRGDSQLSTPRSLLRRSIKRALYPILLRRFDAFLSVGTKATAYLRHYGVPANLIFPSPHVVDNERFLRAISALGLDARRVLRDELGIAPTRSVVLYVGRLLSIKRPLDVIDGVANAHHKDNVTVVFVGNGELSGRIASRAKERMVDVRLAGFRNQSELPSFYGIADALVLPGDETWGMVVNEAMVCGVVPIVSLAAGCVPDLVEPAVSGEAFEMGNAESLGTAIDRALEGAAVGRYVAALRERCERYSPESAAALMLGAAASVKRSGRVAA